MRNSSALDTTLHNRPVLESVLFAFVITGGAGLVATRNIGADSIKGLPFTSKAQTELLSNIQPGFTTSLVGMTPAAADRMSQQPLATPSFDFAKLETLVPPEFTDVANSLDSLSPVAGQSPRSAQAAFARPAPSSLDAGVTGPKVHQLAADKVAAVSSQDRTPQRAVKSSPVPVALAPQLHLAPAGALTLSPPLVGSSKTDSETTAALVPATQPGPMSANTTSASETADFYRVNQTPLTVSPTVPPISVIATAAEKELGSLDLSRLGQIAQSAEPAASTPPPSATAFANKPSAPKSAGVLPESEAAIGAGKVAKMAATQVPAGRPGASDISRLPSASRGRGDAAQPNRDEAFPAFAGQADTPQSLRAGPGQNGLWSLSPSPERVASRTPAIDGRYAPRKNSPSLTSSRGMASVKNTSVGVHQYTVTEGTIYFTMPVAVDGHDSGTLPIRVGQDRSISVKLGDLLALCQQQMEPNLYAALNTSKNADAYVDFDTIRNAGIGVKYDAAHDRILLSAD